MMRKFMATLLVTGLVTGLVTEAGAVVISDNFDGAGWQPYPKSPPANGWDSNNPPAAGQSEAQAGIGYLGTAGLKYPTATSGSNGIRQDVNATSGTLIAGGLFNVAGNNVNYGFVGYRDDTGAGVDVIYLFVRTAGFELHTEGPNGRPERQIGVANMQAMGWLEAQMTFDLDANTASARYRDVDDAGVNAPGPWIDLGLFGDAGATPNTNIVMDADAIYFVSGTSNHTVAGGGAHLDNVYLVPEPASLSLLVLGGLVMLRRRTG